MDITIAYFHSLLRPEVVKHDFDQIRAAGASSIVYTIHEQEEQRWPRDLERGLRLAQDAGLKVYLSLGRYGNLFAGPSLVPSWYTFHNVKSRVKDRHGRYHDISCFNHEPFRAWLCKEITYFVSNYPLYGILIDEPRHSDVTCFCSVCRALCPDVADLQRFRRRSMIDFLDELCTCVKQADARAKTAIVLLPKDLEQLEELAMLPNLDIVGCHLFWSSLKQDVAQVEVWGQNVADMARLYDKRSQLWLQNFNLDDNGEQELKVAFKHILNAEPDEVGCYYYWRNNIDPERVWQSTRGLLRHVPRRQLHWHTGSLPALSGKWEEKHSL